MQAIRNVFAAFANLTASINALASVIQTAATTLELQIGGAENQETPKRIGKKPVTDYDRET